MMDRMANHVMCLSATLQQQRAEAAKLDKAIAANLKELGYGE